MDKVRNWRLWRITFFVLLTAVFTLACNRLPPSQSSTLSVIPSETAPGPTTTGTLPPIETYEDLGVLRNEDPALIDNSTFPITPTSAIHPTVSAPPVDIANYSLTVDGLVDTPLSLSYGAILKYPSVTEVVLLICQGAFVDNAEWTGVPVATLLKEAGVKPQAVQVATHGIDRYEKGLKLADIQKDGVFLAYKVNGEILPGEHGYPIRLVVKGKYGVFWTKWVNRLEVK
jgi:DMSO/TMAO reductase YedYZ molybdopterin-dependent catalytic subunit